MAGQVGPSPSRLTETSEANLGIVRPPIEILSQWLQLTCHVGPNTHQSPIRACPTGAKVPNPSPAL